MKASFPAGSLSEGLQERIDAGYSARPFSVFWETRTLLCLGLAAWNSFSGQQPSAPSSSADPGMHGGGGGFGGGGSQGKF